MRDDPGFFDIDGRLEELSAKGDDLERLKGIVERRVRRKRGPSTSCHWPWRWPLASAWPWAFCDGFSELSIFVAGSFMP